MGLKDFFRNGVHPAEMKDLTASSPIRRMPFPEEVILPVRQHIGAPAKLLVKKGDYVQRGETLAEAGGFVSAPVHASASGTVAKIAKAPHPDGSWSDAIHLKLDPWSAQAQQDRIIPPWENLSKKELVGAIQNAGVVGMGGAAFPTHVKLSPPEDKKIDVILLNGCECEPYLTTDHRLMVEYPHRVWTGIQIMQRCLGVDRAIIGIERNKPDALRIMRETMPAGMNAEVIGLTVKYPQGAEKMLIKALMDKEVPEGGLPMDVGIVVQNVASAASIAEVFETGLPLIERVLTVTGSGLNKPGNLLVPVGAKLQDVVDACGGFTEDAAELIMGGPMMGTAQAHMDTPVLKGTSGIVVLNHAEASPKETMPCIQCGKCLDACPVFLDPQHLGALAKNLEYDEMMNFHLSTCMLCGCCSYACPSGIPLSHLFTLSKVTLRGQGVRV